MEITIVNDLNLVNKELKKEEEINQKKEVKTKV